MNSPPDREQALARLTEELERLRDLGELANDEALAGQFDLPVDVVRQCCAGFEAMHALLESPDTLDDGTAQLPAHLPLPEDFEVEAEIGRGGMGIVYRAVQKSLGRTVAIKVLRPGDERHGEALERFRREAHALARLRHPHIVTIHHVGEVEGSIYYVMEWVKGGTLADLLSSQRRAMPIAKTVRLMLQVTSAVAHFHEHGLIHRDLKPANILLDEAGDAQVADFGLARDPAAGATLTSTGNLLGTPDTMAPEQALGDRREIGETTDVYALGAVLYECLTQRRLFGDRPLVEKIRAVVEEEPRPPRKWDPRIPADLEVICLKALAKRPADRYPTARAMLEDLERFASGRAIEARTPSKLRSAWMWVRRNRGMVGAVALTALVVGSLSWWTLRPDPNSSAQQQMATAESLRDAGQLRSARMVLKEALADVPREDDNLHFDVQSALLRNILDEVRAEFDAGATEVSAEMLAALEEVPDDVTRRVDHVDRESQWRELRWGFMQAEREALRSASELAYDTLLQTVRGPGHRVTDPIDPQEVRDAIVEPVLSDLSPHHPFHQLVLTSWLTGATRSGISLGWHGSELRDRGVSLPAAVECLYLAATKIKRADDYVQAACLDEPWTLCHPATAAERRELLETYARLVDHPELSGKLRIFAARSHAALADVPPIAAPERWDSLPDGWRSQRELAEAVVEMEFGDAMVAKLSFCRSALADSPSEELRFELNAWLDAQLPRWALRTPPARGNDWERWLAEVGPDGWRGALEERVGIRGELDHEDVERLLHEMGDTSGRDAHLMLSLHFPDAEYAPWWPAAGPVTRDRGQRVGRWRMALGPDAASPRRLRLAGVRVLDGVPSLTWTRDIEVRPSQKVEFQTVRAVAAEPALTTSKGRCLPVQLPSVHTHRLTFWNERFQLRYELGTAGPQLRVLSARRQFKGVGWGERMSDVVGPGVTMVGSINEAFDSRRGVDRRLTLARIEGPGDSPLVSLDDWRQALAKHLEDDRSAIRDWDPRDELPFEQRLTRRCELAAAIGVPQARDTLRELHETLAAPSEQDRHLSRLRSHLRLAQLAAAGETATGHPQEERVTALTADDQTAHRWRHGGLLFGAAVVACWIWVALRRLTPRAHYVALALSLLIGVPLACGSFSLDDARNVDLNLGAVGLVSVTLAFALAVRLSGSLSTAGIAGLIGASAVIHFVAECGMTGSRGPALVELGLVLALCLSPWLLHCLVPRRLVLRRVLWLDLIIAATVALEAVWPLMQEIANPLQNVSDALASIANGEEVEWERGRAWDRRRWGAPVDWAAGWVMLRLLFLAYLRAGSELHAMAMQRILRRRMQRAESVIS